MKCSQIFLMPTSMRESPAGGAGVAAGGHLAWFILDVAAKVNLGVPPPGHPKDGAGQAGV